MTGMKERTALIHEGLRALIAREAARRLAMLGGSEPHLVVAERRRPAKLMILVDTSVWIDHFRKGEPELALALSRERVLMHPFVLGELACGNLQNRREILRLLEKLPRITTARDNEVLQFIENHRLMGRGVGYVDAHLLAAVAIHGTAELWTRDKALAGTAFRVKLSRARG